MRGDGSPPSGGGPGRGPRDQDPWIEILLTALARGRRRVRSAVEHVDERLDAAPDWVRRTLLVGAASVAAFLILGVVLAVGVYASTDVPEALTLEPTVVVDVHGREVGTLRQGSDATVSVDALPRHVVHAVLSAEDRRFHDHGGVSLAGTARALVTNVRAGATEQGGSTITQQYVGSVLFEDQPGYREKVREAVISLKLDGSLGKDDILERYLNTVYFGRGAHGISAASEAYFGKPIAEITPNEAATLAAVISRPSELDPREDPEALDHRRRYVLEGMRGQGWLDQRETETALQEGLPQTIDPARLPDDPGAYYLDAVRQQVAEIVGEDAIAAGYRVEIDMDLHLQQLAEQVMVERLADAGHTGALVSIDPRDGGVRALVGGPSYRAQPLNTAVGSTRQPGSSFKPFTLAAFIEAGYDPASTFDAPRTYEVETPQGPHEVENYGGASYGSQSVEEATRSSTNTVYTQMVEKIGPEAVVDVARRAGITSDLPPVPSITLGTGGVRPIELATAYATFAADGVRNGPRLIRRIENQDGEVVHDEGAADEPVIDPNVSRTVTELLTGVIDSGTGTAADIGRPAAGKTGTTDDHRDAWFAGYVPSLATVVWYGRGDNAPLDGMAGGDAPAETWAAFMAAALEQVPPEDFPAAEGLDLEVLNEETPPPPSPEEEKEEKDQEKEQDGDGGGDGPQGEGRGKD